ncbi:MAG: HDIG domain-containing protein [Deltaproteobacteria bacterium]|nr:HDIG domain-containing protein [Deltaproteobacteria bacterium]
MRTPRARNYATAFSGAVLSILLAFCCLAAHTFELWIPSWEVKAGEEAPVTVRLPSRYFRITMLRNEFHYLSTTSSSCPHLVPRGTRLKPGSECAGLVKAFESTRRRQQPIQLAGLFVFYLITGLLLAVFMRYQNMGRARLLRAQITVFTLLMLLIIGSKAVLLLTALPAVVLPVVSIPLLTAYYFRRRIAFIVALVSALLTSSLLNFDIEFFFIYLVSSLTVVVSRKRRSRAWIQLKGGAFAAWVAVLFTVVTTLVFSGTLHIHDDVTEHLDPRYSLWISALLGGLGSGIIAWLLTPIVGRLVGEVSRGRLLDLQDLNQRLLGLLRERAPGTWEHSRAMANLAEGATNAIGGNALLARIGAYYHDIGKSNGPEYFIENQGGGPNPHDELTSEESASRIFRHVTEGTRLVRAEGLPEDVVEFCYSHHGSSVLEYFWHKNMADGNPDDLTEDDFAYPGYKPTTRETGILMVVDAIEAAARTVDSPEKTAFQNLVQRIIFSKLYQGQLDETGLSVSDLRVVANTLVDALVNMYHARIKYPWQTGDTGAIKRTDATPTSTSASTEEPVSDKALVQSDDAVPVDQTPIASISKGEPKPVPAPASGKLPGSRTTLPGVSEKDAQKKAK